MSDLEDRLLKAKDALASLRGTAIDEGVGYYFHYLESQECPGEADLAAARDAAERALKDRVYSLEWLSAMNSGKPISEEDAASLRLKFDAVAPSLVVPAPQVISDLSPTRMGIAAAVGAVGGMMILAPLARVLLDMRDTGIFVGAPLGAFLLVLAAWHAANSKWLRGVLIGALGVATIAELWAILAGSGVFSRVWGLLGGRRSGIQRVFLYVCAIFVLLFAKPRPRCDRGGYEDTVRSAVEQWMDGAITAVSVFGCPADAGEDGEADYQGMYYALVHRIQSLGRVPQETLPAAVQELYEDVGAEESENTFVWQEDMRDKYDIFGHVEPGDMVQVEDPPVILEGTVRRKGLVRKVRGGR